jgi:hypothetical protein
VFKKKDSSDNPIIQWIQILKYYSKQNWVTMNQMWCMDFVYYKSFSNPVLEGLDLKLIWFNICMRTVRD